MQYRPSRPTSQVTAVAEGIFKKLDSLIEQVDHDMEEIPAYEAKVHAAEVKAKKVATSE